MLPEMQGYSSDKEQERFVHLYNKLYFQVIEEADVIITSCQSFTRRSLGSRKAVESFLDLPNPPAYDKFSGWLLLGFYFSSSYIYLLT